MQILGKIPQEIKPFFFAAIAVVCCAVFAYVSLYVFDMGPDNAVEEASEKVIEEVSGVKVDFSGGKKNESSSSSSGS